MNTTAGDITEITFNHPTIGSGTVYPKSNEDGTFVLGGFQSVDDENMIDGKGDSIDQMNRVRWSVETTIAWDNLNAQDLEKFVALASSPEEAEFTFSLVSGSVYGGKGKPVGQLAGAVNGGTFPVKLSGGQKLKKIV